MMEHKIFNRVVGLFFIAAVVAGTGNVFAADEVARRVKVTHLPDPSRAPQNPSATGTRPNQTPTHHPGNDPHCRMAEPAQTCCIEGLINQDGVITDAEKIACCKRIHGDDPERAYCCIINDRNNDFRVSQGEQRKCPPCDPCEEEKKQYGKDSNEYRCCVDPNDSHCDRDDPCKKYEETCNDQRNQGVPQPTPECLRAKCCDNEVLVESCGGNVDGCLNFNCCWNPDSPQCQPD